MSKSAMPAQILKEIWLSMPSLSTLKVQRHHKMTDSSLGEPYPGFENEVQQQLKKADA